ncbi:hypothetical protein ACU635_14300 [[Actinomadura] parvosata]|uniref:hypothetical protein n=1 Tax=[Actinomadura] parvosata TaxID=1955412 RepID=UPI00406CD8B9
MLRRNSFNGGSAGVAVTVANSGGTSGDAFQVTNGSPTYVAASGPRAPLAAQLNDPDTVQWRNLALAGRELWLRGYVLFAQLPSAEDWFLELNSLNGSTATEAGRLTIGPTGTIAFRRTFSEPILCSVPNAIAAGQWMRLELRVLVGTTSSNGAVNLWVYPVPEAATTTLQASVTAVNTGTAVINEAAFVYVPGYTYTLDDFAVTDAGKLGPAYPSNPAIAVQQTSTAEQAQPVTRRKLRIPGQLATLETAAPILPIKRRVLGQTVEATSASPITARKVRAIGTVLEAGAASPLTPAHRHELGTAEETEQAHPFTNGTFIGAAAETAQALPITPRKMRLLGQALDGNLAIEVRPARARTLSTASESGIAVAIRPRKIHVVRPAVEADQAQPLHVLGRDITGVEGPRRRWGGNSGRRLWIAEQRRRVWSASTHR